MTHPPLHTEVALQIQKPCPKSWSELIGDERKRFCSECSLHVHNAAQLSQREAQDIVSGASSRVCMRIQYDPRGTPIFRDSKPNEVSSARVSEPRAVRRSITLARWALSAAAGLLAACHGSLSTSASNDPSAGPNAGQPPSRMGMVCATERLGDVAMPPSQGPERLGEAMAIPDPAPARSPKAPTPKDDE